MAFLKVKAFVCFVEGYKLEECAVFKCRQRCERRSMQAKCIQPGMLSFRYTYNPRNEIINKIMFERVNMNK